MAVLFENRNVRCVLLDAVGTLIHVRSPVAAVYQRVGSRHGSRLTADEIRNRFESALSRHHVGGPTSEVLERDRWRAIVADVLHDIPHAAEESFAELWEEFALPDQWCVFDDVAPLWEQLRAAGVRNGIASNFDVRLWPICCALPPLHTADYFFVSSQVGFAKPHPEFFRAVERTLSLAPSEILLVGDSFENDVCGARNAGWHAVHLDRSGHSPQSIRTLRELTEQGRELRVEVSRAAQARRSNF